MSEYTRRRLLALGGAGVAGAVAGCSGPENTAEAGGEPTSEPADTSGGPVLETVTLQNLSEESQTLDVIIQWDDGDGEIEYWETHELDEVIDGSGSTITLDSGWPTDRGSFQITVRLNDGTRAGFSSTQLADRDCLNLVVLISSEEELSILTDVSGESCSTAATGGTEPSDQ